VHDNGYVELPYTLPQDSTLFLILGERHPDIWMQKLEWVAKHGGMALVGVHPDYMDFSGRPREGEEYPAAFYERFLEHVRDKYSGQYWHTTPRELAEWYRATRPKFTETREAGPPEGGSLRGKRAAVVLYSYYPSDARPRREAEALVKAGMEVELICLREHASEPKYQNVNGVLVKRLPLSRRRDSKFTYVMQYGWFILLSSATLASRCLRRRYDLVHVHNMPDVLVVSGLVPKLFGARIILDLHDPMPELMMTIFRLSERSWGVALLKWLEKWSIRLADQVITVNLACKKIFSGRSCKPEKILVVMNSPDEQIFSFSRYAGQPDRLQDGPFVIMYHGSIVERHGLDLAVEALRSIKKKIPQVELRVYGARTRFLDVVMDSLEQNGLRDSVSYFGPQNHEQIAKAIQQCDVGVIPNRRSKFTEINTPTRIFEYLSRGKPVIAPDVPGITDYFGQKDLIYFRLGDAEDLARKLEYVHGRPIEVEQSIHRGQEVYLGHTWSQEKSRFLGRVRDLVNGSTRSGNGH
jgi:glycosyltransferase involved in cell wall biosynthesis